MEKNKMLIDATHPEETRVVVLRNGRVEEFDYESAARKPLRGNIYLAKVTRVEPSLQAAFVDYGGNRHGFLAFSEIHPDYYQIPVADRQALLREEAEADAEAEAEADAQAEAAAGDEEPHEGEPIEPGEPSAAAEPPRAEAAFGEAEREPAPPLDAEGFASNLPLGVSEPRADVLKSEPVADDAAPETHIHPGAEDGGASHANGELQPAETAGDVGHVEEIASDPADAPETVTSVESEDAMEEVPERPRRRMRSYKIQEVIKRRQIILVQVVKEERGGKGAALTTYLSLAGRYTVLMPNTGRGGGISRKITNPQDRKRLKSIAHELEVPEGMGLIIRTAGASRTKQEIKRDFEYEIRLWESVRDMTLKSTAPCLVYEEGNLIKRSIRDLYAKDIEEILVAGEAAHNEAQDFMRMLSPSQAKNVIKYEAPEPLFNRYQIERQLNAMFSPYVTLRSGGYLVINQTEALVSIDVNSGKATREFSIEETALHTNLEAAEEIARQLKLRDLAGLIVIDFIDMEERRNNRKVEGRLKEALRHDRARIQVGRISHFGLLEMSRQRLRTGVLEGSTTQCPHCQGTGIIRSVESVALAVLRALEDHLLRDANSGLVGVTTANVALYILNNKRTFITDMEGRYGVPITVQASDRMQGGNFAIERSATPLLPQRLPERAAVNMDWGFDADGSEDEERPERPERPERVERAEAASPAEEEGEGRRGRRRRRRGRRDGREEARAAAPSEAALDGHQLAASENGALSEPPAWEEGEAHAEPISEPPGIGEQPTIADEPRALSEEEREDRRGRRGRRRGRRGGRRGRDREGHRAQADERDGEQAGNGHDHDGPVADAGEAEATPAPAAEGEAAAVAPSAAPPQPEETSFAAPPSLAEPEPAAQPRWEREAQAARENGREEPAPIADNGASAGRAAATAPEPEPLPFTPAPPGEPAEAEAEEDSSRPIRRGWWQRRFTSTS
jgi:ribonuclease E